MQARAYRCHVRCSLPCSVIKVIIKHMSVFLFLFVYGLNRSKVESKITKTFFDGRSMLRIHDTRIARSVHRSRKAFFRPLPLISKKTSDRYTLDGDEFRAAPTFEKLKWLESRDEDQM